MDGMRPLYLLGYALGTTANLLARPLAAHVRLRCLVADLRLENTVLQAEAAALAAVCDDLARQLAARSLDQHADDAERLAGPISSNEYADAMAVLDTDLTAQDLTWIWGNE